MSEFFHMGGYGAYVWSSYGIALISMVLLIIFPIKQHASEIKRLKGRFRREQVQEKEELESEP